MDVQQQINSVERVVARKHFRAGEMRAVTLSQAYRTTADDLWDACTDAERIPRWFLPVSGELRLGGSYQLEGNAHGVIEECEPPRRFLVSWDFGDQHSFVEVRIVSEGSDTARLFIEHIVDAGNEHWLRFGPGAVGIGWDLALPALQAHLSGAPVDPAEAFTWLASDEGRRFVASAGQGWLEADVASGTPAAQAKTAAENTISFYTGS